MVLSRVLGSTIGHPDSEYIELRGAAGTSLDGLSVIVVEGEDAGQIGDISFRIDFSAGDVLGDNGYFLASNEQAARTFGVMPDLAFHDLIENGSYTIALTETASISGGSVTGQERILDAIGLRNPRGGRRNTFFFDAPVLGPDGKGFLPAGVERIGGEPATPATVAFRFLDFENGIAANRPRSATGETNRGLGANRIDEVPTLISGIQGTTDQSDLVGRRVVVEGIVTGDFQNGDGDAFRNLGGFFLMEEESDFDDDIATSEGIFVNDSILADTVDVAPGDMVRVLGRVVERFGKTTIDPLEIHVEIRRAVADVLPLAVATMLPDMAGREAIESMLVRIDEPLTWIESFDYEISNQGTLAAGGPIYQFTQLNWPDVSGNTAYQREIGDRTILIDDGRDGRRSDGDPIRLPDGVPVSVGNGARMGQQYDLTALVDFAFGAYRLRLPDGVPFEPTGQIGGRPPAPADRSSDYKIGSLNLLNYFTTLSGRTAIGLQPRGAGSAAELSRQTRKLVSMIEKMNVDVIALNEIENDFAGDAVAIKVLVVALNAADGSRRWAYVDPARKFIGSDAIAVGFLYDSSTTRIAPGTNAAVLTDDMLAALGADPGHALFEGRGSSRVPMAVTFEELATGERFTAVAVHLKSKGSVSPFGRNADIGDGQGRNSEARTLAARAIAAWLSGNPTGTVDDDTVILGDLNSYAMEAPVQTLAAAGYVNLVELYESLGATSYRFSGQVGTLDYAMANPEFAEQVTGATIWNINADEPNVFDYALDGTHVSIARPREQGLFDGSNPARASDHDPVIVGLDLRSDDLMLSSRFGIDPFASGSDLASGVAVRNDTGRTQRIESAIANRTKALIRERLLAQRETVTPDLAAISDLRRIMTMPTLIPVSDGPLY